MRNGNARMLHLMAGVILLLTLLLFALPAGAEPETEWTVMFYLCGSDLESRYGYASGNMVEIASCNLPGNLRDSILEGYGVDMGEPEDKSNQVKVVIETGGCKGWHSSELEIEISSTSLQRWEYKAMTPVDAVLNYEEESFHLVDEQPLASMADPETLADFIRWSAENYPAKKYCLVLWDHGGGSKSGLFIDELFDQDIMRLNELKDALDMADVQLETILFDACMMANLETANAVKDHAKWMVASEEVVGGIGTAINGWLQQLYRDPQEDGRRLGIWMCDMTQIKYSNSYNEANATTLTWSLIDLEKVNNLVRNLESFFKGVCAAYEHYPMLMASCLSAIYRTEEYGTGEENMFDLMGIFYDTTVAEIMEEDLRRQTLHDLNDAVVYAVRGSGRSAARGLSFCIATDFSNDELDTYTKNCESPHYLALLDAVSPTWKAPESIYESGQAEKLPELKDIEEYTIRVEKKVTQNGVPALELVSGYANYYDTTYYLYMYNEDLDETVCLGRSVVGFDSDDSGNTVMSATEPWMWPAINDTICTYELIQYNHENTLSEIPIQVGDSNWKLRCGHNEKDGYQIYGVWDGYNADSSQFNRNVKSLAQVAGWQFRLLYPLDTLQGEPVRYYETSDYMTIPRNMVLKPRKLNPGTYYLEYSIQDIFMRQIRTDRIRMDWDGETATFPDIDQWSGEKEMIWMGWPCDLKE